MTNITVRPFQLGDEIAICELHIKSIQELCSKDYAPEVIQIWSNKKPEMYLESIDKNNEKFHVIEVNEKIAGFSGWYGEGIVAFYMSPSYAGQGLGKKLFDVTEKDFWQNSGKEVCKITSTITAKPFYEKMGFSIIEKANHVMNNGQTIIDAWKLEKKKPDA